MYECARRLIHYVFPALSLTQPALSSKRCRCEELRELLHLPWLLKRMILYASGFTGAVAIG